MNENQHSPEQAMEAPFVEGTMVYDVTGEEIGTIVNSDAQDGYFLVHAGWMSPKGAAIPMSAISHIDIDGVHLRVSRDQLQFQELS